VIGDAQARYFGTELHGGEVTPSDSARIAALPKSVPHGLMCVATKPGCSSDSSRRVPNTSSCAATRETRPRAVRDRASRPRACNLTSNDHKVRGDPRRWWRT
jgi:hypothetical protein